MDVIVTWDQIRTRFYDLEFQRVQCRDCNTVFIREVSTNRWFFHRRSYREINRFTCKHQWFRVSDADKQVRGKKSDLPFFDMFPPSKRYWTSVANCRRCGYQWNVKADVEKYHENGREVCRQISPWVKAGR